MKFIIFIQILCLLQNNHFFGQQKIEGKITCEGKEIINASILLKKINSESILKYSTSN
jgi:hypothetical protein